MPENFYREALSLTLWLFHKDKLPVAMEIPVVYIILKLESELWYFICWLFSPPKHSTLIITFISNVCKGYAIFSLLFLPCEMHQNQHEDLLPVLNVVNQMSVFSFILCLCLVSLFSIISWRSVLLVVETVVPGGNPWSATNHWQTLSHNVVSSAPHHGWDSNSQL